MAHPVVAIALLSVIGGCAASKPTPTPVPTPPAVNSLAVIGASGLLTMGAKQGDVLYDATMVLRNTSVQPISIDSVAMVGIADPVASVSTVSVIEVPDTLDAGVGFFRQPPWTLWTSLRPAPLGQAALLPAKTYALVVKVHMDKSGTWIPAFTMVYTDDGTRRSATIPGPTGQASKVCINPDKSLTC